MPQTSSCPTSWEEVKDGKFYIINGQRTWAAVNRLLDSPAATDVLKDDYMHWQCNFVWTTEKVALSELARRINNTNQFRWDSPEYLLHIQYARDLWVQYGMPFPTNKDAFKIHFHSCSYDVLSSLLVRDDVVVPVGNCPLAISAVKLSQVERNGAIEKW